MANLQNRGNHSSFSDVVQALKVELKKEVYHCVIEDLNMHLDNYLNDPLTNYDNDFADILLEALGMAFKVNMCYFQSDMNKCDVFSVFNANNDFKDTFYFLRTKSLHFDAVLHKQYKSPEVLTIDDDNNDNMTDDLQSNVEFHNHGNENDDDSDVSFAFDRASENHVSDDDCIITIDDSTQRQEENFSGNLFSEINVTVVSDDDCFPAGVKNEGMKDEDNINYENPSSEFLLNVILCDSATYEVDNPMQCVRRNTIYTIKNKTQEQITNDGNGAYINSRSTSRNFFVEIENNKVTECNVIHKDGNLYFYNKRFTSRSYKKTFVGSESIHCIKRYYRYNKSVPSLRLMITKVFVNGTEHPYTCVMYYNGSDEDHQDNLVVLPHGNSKSLQPYIRTDKKVLDSIDNKLDSQSDSDIFHSVLGEFGGPIHSTSSSTEPRNQKQVANRRALKRRLETPSPSWLLNAPCGDLEKLLRLQRDPNSPVKTVLISGDWFMAFIYTERQLNDIAKFCCNEDDVDISVLGVDTTFNMCDMWLTDTSYRNKRLKTVRSHRKKSPVFMGPAMLHHSKDEETFRRFCCELIAAKPTLSDLKVIGVDMEAAIYNGFKSVIRKLVRLLCVRHLRQRDEKAIDKLLENVRRSEDQKGLVKNEILSDIYGQRISEEEYENGLAESLDENDFIVKLTSLEDKWERLCPRFHRWFIANRKDDFVASVVQSAREGTSVAGLFYQNDIESIHAKQKRSQIKKGNIYDAVMTLSKVIEMENDEEILSLYGKGNFVLSPEYARFFTKNWHSLSAQKRLEHVDAFRQSLPGLSFSRPSNSGRKPHQSPRIRHSKEPTIFIDRLPQVTPVSATAAFIQPTLVNGSSTPASDATTAARETATVSARASFSTETLTSNIEDPRSQRPQVFELHLKSLLSKRVRRCRGDCVEPITDKHTFVVKSYGLATWTDKKTGEVNVSHGALYCHFRDDCLKKLDSKKIYLDFEQFDYSKIKVCPNTKAKLTDTDLAQLIQFGVTVN